MSAASPFAKLNVFSLAMINVIAVDSLRTLPLGAVYGFSVVFVYLLLGLFFFLPSILVTAELATGWPNTGGSYVWIREAFGPRCGFVAIWLQWVYNIVWYPTIFSFMATTLAYLIDPSLADSKAYMVGTMLALFACATLLNLYGMRVSSWVSTIGALFGTLFPMLLILGLGAVWVCQKRSPEAFFSWHSFFPHGQGKNISFLGTVLFGLMGMEMSAAHAEDVRTPKRDYPRALALSGGVILLTLMGSSLAIAVVVPPETLHVVSGLVDAFTLFLRAYHLESLRGGILFCMLLGSLSCSSAWILGPARCLAVATRETCLPARLQKTNRHGVPLGLLGVQSFLFVLLTSLFLFLPTVSASYWMLSDLTAQLALLFYVLLFASAIKLRYQQPHVARSYRIPGGKIGMWTACGFAITTCVVAMGLGFLPPAHVPVGEVWLYELLLCAGLLLFALPPLLLFRDKPHKATHDTMGSKN